MKGDRYKIHRDQLLITGKEVQHERRYTILSDNTKGIARSDTAVADMKNIKMAHKILKYNVYAD
jgi:hypothetical protein